jgi:hypothetical protein
MWQLPQKSVFSESRVVLQAKEFLSSMVGALIHGGAGPLDLSFQM